MRYLSRKNGRVVGVDCLVNVKFLLRSNTYSIDPRRLGIRRADAKTVNLFVALLAIVVESSLTMLYRCWSLGNTSTEVDAEY